MKSQLNNALAFFQVVAIITNLSTFADAKIRNKNEMAKKCFHKADVYTQYFAHDGVKILL